MLDVSIRLEVLDVIDQLRDALRARRPLHHARHRLGALFRRRDARHVRGRDRRARPLGGRHPAPRPPLHPAAARRGARSGPARRSGRRAAAACRARQAGERSARRRPAAASAPAARSPTSAAGPSRRRCGRSTRSERRPAGGIDVAAPELVTRIHGERSVPMTPRTTGRQPGATAALPRRAESDGTCGTRAATIELHHCCKKGT